MSKYKVLKPIKGTTRRYMYKADDATAFHAVKTAMVPDRVQAVLVNQADGTVFDMISGIEGAESSSVQQVQPDDRRCIFCGQPGTKRKFVFLQMVFLCDEHYNNKTTGEVGQRIKELQHGKQEEEEKDNR